MNRKQQQRKKFFIDREVQGALLRRLALHWCVAFLMTFACLFVMECLANPDVRDFQQHAESIWRRYSILVVVVLCTLPAFAYDSIKMSHRFVGPMYATRTTLRKIARGEPVDGLRFRDGDYWQDVAGDITIIAQRLKSFDGQAAEQPAGASNELRDANITPPSDHAPSEANHPVHS